MAKKQALKSKPERPDDFKQALTYYKEASDHWKDQRKNYIDDVKFARLGDQWPDRIRKQRDADGRPCLTINKLPAFIRQVVNDARQNKPSIKIHPVDDNSDVETAEILNGLVRNIEYTSDADVAYDTALDDAVTGGFGFFRIDLVYADDDTFEQDIKIAPIPNPMMVFWDARTQASDSSDWKYCFVAEMITEEEHKARFPGKEISAFASDDRDELDQYWFEEKLVRIAEYWCVKEVPRTIVKLSNGAILPQEQYQQQRQLFDALQITVVDQRETMTRKVTQRIMNGYEWLTDETEWAGKYIPVIPVYGEEINVEGVRHFLSLVRPAKDPQMMFNYWRTASTELVALAPKAPWVGPVGSFETDSDKWSSANTDNHAYIEYDNKGVPPQRQAFAGPPAGALQEALNASDDIKSITGIYDAALGARSNETSGRAIQARQRESDVGTFHFIDNQTRALRHAGRILVDLIPKVYSAPRVIRTIGLDGSNERVKVNEPHIGEDGVERIYDLTTGKYDVTCEAGPSYTTQREEAAEQMTEFVRTVPQAGQLIGDLIAKNMDWPGADEIAERLKLMLPPQVQSKDNPIPPQVQQHMQQMQQALQQLMQENNSLKQDKTGEVQKVKIDGYNAETNRLKTVFSALPPEILQAIAAQTLQQVINSPDILPGAMPNGPPPQQPAPPQPPPGGFFSPGVSPTQ